MNKESFFSRYSLIIQKLEMKPSTFDEIEQHLLNSFEFQDAGIKNYSIRTMQRDVKQISQLFSMEIKCDRKRENRYYIASKPELEQDEYNKKLLESFHVSNAVNMHPEFAEHLFFETRKPMGLEHFYNLYFAIRNKRVIKFEHYKFKNNEISDRKVYPLALKETKGRWYVLAVDTKDDQIKSFGLDRISYLDVQKGKYKGNFKSKLKEHYKNSFGVIALGSTNQVPQKTVIRTTREQGEYIKSYPLHTSQTTVEENDKGFTFELLLYPTYDFMQELLSFGKEIEVLEPRCLIDDIKNHLIESLKKYS